MRHSTYLEINLSLLYGNVNKVRQLAPRAKILAMVKADAYGHGMVPVADFLVRECAIPQLGCATLSEALILIKEHPELKEKIYIFSDNELHNPELRDFYLNYNIVPVIYHKNDLRLILDEPSLKKIPVVIKLNTGMNRLGLFHNELEEFIPKLKSRGIYHLMSHFAQSNEVISTGDKTYLQYNEFLKIKNNLINAGVEIQETSISNSGAVEQKFGVEETYIRPGIMLYGAPSVIDPILWNGNVISRWVARVVHGFNVKKGASVGYGKNIADRDSFMAIISVGYGDGFLYYYKGISISINGVLGKVFGLINMDMTIVQFEPEAESKIKINDQVEIWNHDNKTITNLCSESHTHANQMMCAVSTRIPRIYKRS